MKKKISLFAVFFMGFLIFQNSVIAQHTQRPNVLFISVDDLRPTLGVYGDSIAITPNIDKLAKQGFKFNRAFVQQAQCAQSRTSIFTGLRPDEVQVTNMVTHFRDTRPEVVTLPQLFKQKEYETVGIGKLFHYRQGFQDPTSWTVELYGSNRGVKKSQYVLSKNHIGGKASATESSNVTDSAYLDGKFTDLAIDFLRKFKNRETPFFLGIGYLKPHLPFTAPEKYWKMYNREDFYPIKKPKRPTNSPDIAFHNWQELRGYTDIPEKGYLSIEKQRELRHGYYASVSFIDAQIGKVLTVLNELGLRKNTIIVFLSDHGYHLGEKNLWGKTTNFELDTHIPLIMSVPGKSQHNVTIDAIVEAVDIYPTLIDLLGFESEHKLSGESLTPLLEKPRTEWENIAFSQFPRPQGALTEREEVSHMGYSVRSNNWRYTGWYNIEEESFEYPELYYMKESKVESQNLARNEEYDKIEERHYRLVKKYMDQKYKK